MPSDYILQLNNVTVELGGEIILKNVNLNVSHHETLVIVGPSGGGKTVMLKTMAGIFKPKQGQVFCEGEDWQNLQSEQKRKLAQHIGMQFQKSALFDSITTFENVAFPLREYFSDLSETEIRERVKICLESVDLWHAKNLMPHELSGGMQLRLGVARAFVLKPKIIFYDDPTAGLDPVNSDNMVLLMKSLKEKYQATLIVTTHSIEIAYQLADRIVLVCNQEVIEVGTPEETKAHPDPRVQQFIHGRLDGPLVWG